MIWNKRCKNVRTWKFEKLMPLWGRTNFDSVLRHRRPKFQQTTARAVREIHVESESSGSDIDACGSTSDSDRHKGYMATATDCAQKPDRYNVYMTTAADRATNPGEPIIRREQVDRDRHYDRGKPQTVCTHCGSKRHDDRAFGRDLRVRSVDVWVILRTIATTCVPYARTSTRKESARWNSFTT